MEVFKDAHDPGYLEMEFQVYVDPNGDVHWYVHAYVFYVENHAIDTLTFYKSFKNLTATQVIILMLRHCQRMVKINNKPPLSILGWTVTRLLAKELKWGEIITFATLEEIYAPLTPHEKISLSKYLR